jgi:hypothetical protein
MVFVRLIDVFHGEIELILMMFELAAEFGSAIGEPTYSSWLNQAELWFAKSSLTCSLAEIVTSVADSSRKIRRCICAYAKVARPFRWSLSDPAKRIIADSMTGTAY